MNPLVAPGTERALALREFHRFQGKDAEFLYLVPSVN